MEGSVQLEPMIRPVTRGATLLSPLLSPRLPCWEQSAAGPCGRITRRPLQPSRAEPSRQTKNPATAPARPAASLLQRHAGDGRRTVDDDPGYMSSKIRKFRTGINSIRKTNGNFDSCNS